MNRAIAMRFQQNRQEKPRFPAFSERFRRNCGGAGTNERRMG